MCSFCTVESFHEILLDLIRSKKQDGTNQITNNISLKIIKYRAYIMHMIHSFHMQW